MFGKKETKMAKKNIDNITTLIGDGSFIEGTINSSSSARIEGSFKGTVKINSSLIIGNKGNVNGDIDAEHVVVYGVVEGTLKAKVLELKNMGNIIGDVTVQSLSVEEGGVLNGKCTMKSLEAVVDKDTEPASAFKSGS